MKKDIIKKDEMRIIIIGVTIRWMKRMRLYSE